MLLLYAVIFINLALISYTTGVWSEKIAGSLKPKHLIFFWAGLVFDTIGTMVMKRLNTHHVINIHGVTGAIALWLMFIHAIWATFVIWKKREDELKKFHRLSLIVWTMWLVPYFIGVGLGISRVH